MEKRKNFRWISSLLTNISIACLAIFVFGTRLNVNDDSSISWMVYGISTDPSSRIYYTHWILGWICGHLFSLIPKFNWQTLIYYLGIIFSGTVGLYSVLEKKRSLLVGFWFLFELVFFHDVYLTLTFSVVSAFASCQGYLALFLATKEKAPRLSSYAMAGISILFSSMVRVDSFWGISGFAFFVWMILVVLEFRDNKKTEVIFRRYFCPFVAIVGLCFLLIGVDKLAYSKGAWKAYHEYESIRLKFTDYRNTLNSMEPDELEKYGFKTSMKDALLEWRNNDPEKLTAKNLELLAKPSVQCNSIANPIVWSDYFSALKYIFTQYFETYFSLLLLIYVMMNIKKKGDALKNGLPLLLMVPFLLEFFYFAYVGRIDGGAILERCVYIVLMGFAMANIALYGALGNDENNKTFFSIVCLMILVATSIIGLTVKDFGVNGLGLVDTDEIQEDYRFLGKNDKVYVCDVWALAEIDERYSAWQVPATGFLKHCISLGGWTVNHPMQNEKQASLNCKNPYRALFENEDVYFVRKKPSEEEAVLKYLQENYDSRIEMEYIKEKGDFKVFKYYLK